MKPIDVSLDYAIQQQFDYIVVGGGMYGCYFAQKMAFASQFNARILLIERGGRRLNTHEDNLPKFSVDRGQLFDGAPFTANVNQQPDHGVAWDVHALGGKSTVWGRWSPRLTHHALAHWPEYIRRHINSWYQIAERDLFVNQGRRIFSNDHFHNFSEWLTTHPIASLETPRLAPVAVQTDPEFPGHFCNGTFSVLPGLFDAMAHCDKSSGSIDILLNTSVEQLELDGDGNIGALILEHQGHMHQLPTRGSPVLLAAGLARSTQLASAVSQHDQIGKGLFTHLRSDLIGAVARDHFLFQDWNWQQYPLFASHCPGRFEGKDFHLQVNIVNDFGEQLDSILYRTMGSNDEMQWRLKQIDQQGQLTFSIYCLGEKEVAGSQFLPEFTHVEWEMTEGDQRLRRHMTQCALELIQRLVQHKPVHWIRRHDNPEDGELGGFYQSMSSSYHEAGTLSRQKGPLNNHGQFKDIPNLWCIDQSGFCPGGSANPVLTGCALILNTVDQLRPAAIKDNATEQALAGI